jgi:phage terminase large subunit
MKIQTTNVFERNADAYRSGKRRALNEGGTYSSKTYSILQLLILIAQSAKQPLLISIVSESLPHLRKGAIRDFFNILGEDPKNCPCYNMTEHLYRPGKGAVEFFGADEADKVRGPRRDILFLNEANNIPWETVRALDTRTRLFTFADWNPVSEFWAHEHWIGQEENAYIHSTYRDALDVVPAEIIQNILRTGERDPNWANIYLEGRIGKVEGLVYPYFEIEDALPKGRAVFGLDFGFSTDVTALGKHVITGDEIHSQELIYEAGLTNDAIARRMDELGIKRHYDEIFADSAEPKSIEEIHRFGFNIKGAPKGADSVEFGHQKVRQYKQFWTKDSLNGIKEQRNFRYITDKDGKLTSKTTHSFSHLMDARRYAIMSLRPPSGVMDKPEETPGRRTALTEIF